MALIGFSTGALAFHDFKQGLHLFKQSGLRAIELSALREPELEPLLESLDTLGLSDFEYISVHAPSAISDGHEYHVVTALGEVANRGWPIIVHPDVIRDPELWNRLGASLTIENNDRRKPGGQRCEEISEWFVKCPEAGFCLDVGHARQVDRTMTEAYLMLKNFGTKLRQLHVSEVGADSKHERLTLLSVQSIKKIAAFIPSGTPAIIESVVPQTYLENEIAAVQRALDPADASHAPPTQNTSESLDSTDSPIF